MHTHTHWLIYNKFHMVTHWNDESLPHVMKLHTISHSFQLNYFWFWFNFRKTKNLQHFFFQMQSNCKINLLVLFITTEFFNKLLYIGPEPQILRLIRAQQKKEERIYEIRISESVGITRIWCHSLYCYYYYYYCEPAERERKKHLCTCMRSVKIHTSHTVGWMEKKSVIQ